jgi:1,4-dihydroxy-2-naphthoyl-CoA hydrolase
MLKKRLCLSKAPLIKTAVHTASLNNVLEIVVGLSVANDVDFFSVQFSIILGAKIRKYYAANSVPEICFMRIFKESATVEALNKWLQNTLPQQLGIEFTVIGDDYLEARMPVDHRTKQPLGLLHGGASVALAETLGSVAATLCVDDTRFCVGLEINANHIKAVRDGFVTGTTRPIHIGKQTQVWEIRITNESGEVVCISRITMAVLEKKK